MRQMFNCLPINLKQRFIIEYQHTKLGKNWCMICMDMALTKKKCIHYECPGMCEKCFNAEDDCCPCCDKKQEIECPVCREVKGKDWVHILEKCHHPVCLQCFTKASLAGAPIKKCPTCRSNF